MGKFRQLSQELWPLIDVKNTFPDIRKEWFRIVDG